VTPYTRCCNAGRPWARRPTRPRAAARCRRTGGTRDSTSSALVAHRHAVPAGGRLRGSVAPTAGPPGEITLVASGEGATSEGEFWEALNAACLGALPVLFLVEDNGYAISVPVEAQTAGGSISKLVAGFPGCCGRKWTARIFWPPIAP
jgi:hypothetical protein